MTAQPNAHIRFRRAIERRALWMAEDAAREIPNLSLEHALMLVHPVCRVRIAEVREGRAALARAVLG